MFRPKFLSALISLILSCLMLFSCGAPAIQTERDERAAKVQANDPASGVEAQEPAENSAATKQNADDDALKAEITLPSLFHVDLQRKIRQSFVKASTDSDPSSASESAVCTHFWCSWMSIKKASCESAGLDSRVCVICMEKENKERAALGHDIAIREAVSATCLTTGLTEGQYCRTCNEELVLQTSTDLAVHSYQDRVVPPSYGEEGYTVHTCTVCAHTVTDSYVDPLSEQYVDYRSFENGNINSNTGVLSSTQKPLRSMDMLRIEDFVSVIIDDGKDEVYHVRYFAYDANKAFLKSSGLLGSFTQEDILTAAPGTAYIYVLLTHSLSTAEGEPVPIMDITKLDEYKLIMKTRPQFGSTDHPIDEISKDGISYFADTNGNFTTSFQVTITDKDFLEEIWILSMNAKYTSVSGDKPTIQIRIINDNGDTLYYSPIYDIGSTREYYRREWRVPPTIDIYDTVRISVTIPAGVTLSIKDMKNKANTRYREGEFGIRYHGHAGFPSYAASNTAFSFQMAAEMGFTSCITIPKFTKDGVGVCFHDDASIRAILRYADGSKIAEGSADDKAISDFTYEELMQFDAGIKKSSIYAGTKVPTMEEFFRICSMTGMQPIFSVHPDLTEEQWLYVKDLLEKYRLLDQFWIKTGRPSTQKITTKIFDDDIAGYIMIQGINSTWDPLTQATACGFDLTRHNVVMEYFYSATTEEKIKTALDEGFRVSVATTDDGISGREMNRLIDLGVTEFTIDHHCSMGLDW